MRRAHSFPKFESLAVCALLATLTGCGRHDLVLRVDILSFTRELQSPFVLPTVPVIPGGATTGELPIVADQTVNLVEGLSDAAKLTEVSLSLRTVATATSGSGTDTLRVYLSDPDTPPRTTPPVLTQVLTISSAAPDTMTGLAQGSRLLDLFAGKSLRVSVTTSARGPASGAPLNATLRVTGFDAAVVARRKS